MAIVTLASNECRFGNTHNCWETVLVYHCECGFVPFRFGPSSETGRGGLERSESIQLLGFRAHPVGPTLHYLGKGL